VKRALLLDCDGVLVDSEPANFAAWRGAFRDLLGVDHAGDPRCLCGLTLDEIFQVFCGRDAGAMAPWLRGAILPRKDALYGEAAVEVLPGVRELIDQARVGGWQVGVVSGARRERLEVNLRALADVEFDLVLAGDDGGGKAYAEAARRLAGEAGRCLAVEDTPIGVRAARAAGIARVVGVTTSLAGERLRAAGAGLVVGDLAGLDLETAWSAS
jgi:sugar-phosphatase